MTQRKTIIELALATLRNYIEGDEHTRDEDAKFALDILERHFLGDASSQDTSRDES